MMKLRLFTLPNCPRCPAAKKVAKTVVKQREDITLEILDISETNNMTTALMMQIASTPSFAINETPIYISDVPTVEELNTLIDQYKQKSKL